MLNLPSFKSFLGINYSPGALCVLNLYTSKQNFYLVCMSKLDRSNLMEFLRKPRCLREIVKHFEVPTKLVDYHLQEAIKSGRVLVYGKDLQKRSLKLEARQLRLEGSFYISRNSPLLAEDVTMKYCLPKTSTSATNEFTHQDHKSSVFPCRKLAFLHNLMAYLELGKAELSGVLSSLSNKMKLAESNKNVLRPKLGKRHDTKFISLSHFEKICLFRAVLEKPLPFLQIHGRFGISKQVVKGLVSRGFFEEVWGPKNIGVKYKLTEKGEVYLRRIEKASHFERQQRRKIFIRLKNRILFQL